MESRVCALDLRVRAPAGRTDTIVPAARDFARRVIERCDELLDQRAPGRLVFMRRLEMQWRVWDHTLDSLDEVDAVAAEMARALDDDLRSRVTSSGDDAEVAVFTDEAHYRADYLVAVSRQRAESCWFFAPLLDEGPPPGLLARPEHRLLTEAVVMRLAADGVLDDVLSALPSAAIDDLATALNVAEPALEAHEAGRVCSPAERALAVFLERHTELPRTVHSHAGDSSPHAEHPRGVTAPAGRDASGAERLIDSVPDDPAERTAVADTTFGGLFYLLSLALELSIGEALWSACVSETPVFARIAEALLASELADDPAPRLFAGGTSTALAAMKEEQHGEMARAILDATVGALTRYPTTDLPSLHLCVVPSASGRLLVAASPQSPFPLFAWPARSADALREGLATLLALWPASAPPLVADPALSSLDRTGRIRAARSANQQPWVLARAEDPFATALLTQTTGSLAFTFAARTGNPKLSAAQLIERHLTVPARILISTEMMDIGMPMDRIDLAVRRAGLDRDPGWVPWLQKRVRFSFFEDCEPT